MRYFSVFFIVLLIGCTTDCGKTIVVREEVTKEPEKHYVDIELTDFEINSIKTNKDKKQIRLPANSNTSHYRSGDYLKVKDSDLILQVVSVRYDMDNFDYPIDEFGYYGVDWKPEYSDKTKQKEAFINYWNQCVPNHPDNGPVWVIYFCIDLK